MALLGMFMGADNAAVALYFYMCRCLHWTKTRLCSFGVARALDELLTPCSRLHCRCVYIKLR